MKNWAPAFVLLSLLLVCPPAWGVTLGESGTGNNSFNPDVDVVRQSQYVCPANGKVNRLMVYILTPAGSARLAIYHDDPNGNTPTGLVVQSGEQTLTTGWNTFVIPSTNVSGGQIYWLACAFSDSPLLAYYGDDPYDYKSVTHHMTYGAFPDPFVVSFAANYTFRYCLYATEVLDTPTFTPSATPTATPSRTLTGTPSATPTGTPSGTPTHLPSGTPSATLTPSPSVTVSPLSTPPATGTITPTATATPPATATAVPTLLSLDPNSVITYPSPAAKNDVWFYYASPAGTRVSIDIFNSAGERVTVLGGQTTVAGYQRTHWDSRSVSPGVYLYRLTLENPAGRRDLGLRKLVVVK